MANQSPYSVVNQGVVAGVVQNPALSAQPLTAQSPMALDRQGAQIVSPVHGAGGAAALNGNVFFAHSPLAGSVVTLSAANLVSKFTLWNPAGSGKNLELLGFSWQQFGTGTEIITQLGLAFQKSVSTTGVPGTQTTQAVGGPFNALIGGGLTSVATFWTAITLANPAIGNSWQHMWLFNTPLATTVTDQSKIVDLSGKVIMPPDTLMSPVAAITGTEIEACMTVWWAEWPI